MQIIFVDYIDGGGGEFLSYALSRHANFYQPTVSETLGRISHKDPITSFLSKSKFHNHNRWDDIAEDYMYKLKEQLLLIGMPRIAIPYHSCTHQHNILLRKVFPGCKIIYIDPKNHYQLIAKEILRKVHLVKLNIHDIKYIHQNVVNLDLGIPINLNDFWHLDILLLRKKIRPVRQARLDLIKQILDHKVQSSQSYDFVVNWADLFLNLDQIKYQYKQLCKFLNIAASASTLNKIIERNENNLQQLQDFDLPGFIAQNFATR